MRLPAAAKDVTLRTRLPGTASGPAVVVTAELLELAVAWVQVEASATLSAAAWRAASFVLMAWYAATSACCALSEVFRRVCGCFSMVISWLTIVVVSRPLTSPSTLATLVLPAKRCGCRYDSSGPEGGVRPPPGPV